MKKKVSGQDRLRLRRKMRTRKKVEGNQERPRLSVFRSSKHIYAQVIDDQTMRTLVSASSMEKGARSSANIEGCKALGEVLAKRCQEKNITQVKFDKNGNKFHGRVKAFADSARESGLSF